VLPACWQFAETEEGAREKGGQGDGLMVMKSMMKSMMMMMLMMLMMESIMTDSNGNGDGEVESWQVKYRGGGQAKDAMDDEKEIRSLDEREWSFIQPSTPSTSTAIRSKSTHQVSHHRHRGSSTQ